MPVGSLKVIPVDIRVIAATNKDLKAMVEQKKFREDLYYRISVLTMRLPSLKERGDDIHLLIQHFLREKSRELGLQVQDAEPAAIQYLASLPYPGNIRQLSNLVERAMVLCKGPRAGFRRCRPRSTYVREHNNRCSGRAAGPSSSCLHGKPPGGTHPRGIGAQQLEPGKDSQGIGHQSQHIVPQNASVWYSSPLNSKLS